jgi:6-phosphogluconate dehydrogenase
MELGVVGCGRMGLGVAQRLVDAGHEVAAFDPDAAARDAAADIGATPVAELPALVEGVDSDIVWLQVPADAVDPALDDLAPHLGSDAVVVEAGNSHHEDSVRRAEAHEFAYLDCGVSGGPGGVDRGFSLMIGGPEPAFDRLEPVFEAIAAPGGYARMGPSGAGHFVKTVHNGVEYALMQAYGEGFELLHHGPYDLDLEDVARTWSNGSVIRSWLLDLAVESFADEGGDLGDVADHVAGGSTGTWAVQAALEHEVPVPLIHAALAERFASRRPRFARRLANRLRHGFGGHPVVRDGDDE